MWNFITLDGYFEGTKNWDLSFHEVIWGQELEKLSIEQLTSADFLVFGRVTVAALALLKFAITNHSSMYIWAATIAYSAFAILFGWQFLQVRNQ